MAIGSADAAEVAAGPVRGPCELGPEAFQTVERLAARTAQLDEERRRAQEACQSVRGSVRVMARIRPRLADEEGESCLKVVSNSQVEVLTASRALPISQRRRRHTTACLPACVGSRSASTLSEASRALSDTSRSTLGEPGVSPSSLETRSYFFDQVFDSDVTDDTVFDSIRNELVAAVEGEAVCILAYGATGSGKTHTVTNLAERVANDLEQQAARLEEEEGKRLEITVQVVEIYNEQLRDLLADCHTDAPRLKVSVSISAPTLLGAATRTITRDSREGIARSLQAALQSGQAMRATSRTSVHGRSSRSHLVMTLYFAVYDTSTGILRNSGKMSLVDLAGSERVKRSEAAGERLREAQHINRSLSALADVISAKERNGPHVPYRNSKLTHLLQDTLGAHQTCRTVIIVALTPTGWCLQETMHSLHFSSRLISLSLQTASQRSLHEQACAKVEDELLRSEADRLRAENAIIRAQLEARDRELQERDRALEERDWQLEVVRQEVLALRSHPRSFGELGPPTGPAAVLAQAVAQQQKVVSGANHSSPATSVRSATASVNDAPVNHLPANAGQAKVAAHVDGAMSARTQQRESFQWPSTSGRSQLGNAAEAMHFIRPDSTEKQRGAGSLPLAHVEATGGIPEVSSGARSGDLAAGDYAQQRLPVSASPPLSPSPTKDTPALGLKGPRGFNPSSEPNGRCYGGPCTQLGHGATPADSSEQSSEAEASVASTAMTPNEVYLGQETSDVPWPSVPSPLLDPAPADARRAQQGRTPLDQPIWGGWRFPLEMGNSLVGSLGQEASVSSSSGAPPSGFASTPTSLLRGASLADQVQRAVAMCERGASSPFSKAALEELTARHLAHRAALDSAVPAPVCEAAGTKPSPAALAAQAMPRAPDPLQPTRLAEPMQLSGTPQVPSPTARERRSPARSSGCRQAPGMRLEDPSPPRFGQTAASSSRTPPEGTVSPAVTRRASRGSESGVQTLLRLPSPALTGRQPSCSSQRSRSAGHHAAGQREYIVRVISPARAKELGQPPDSPVRMKTPQSPALLLCPARIEGGSIFEGVASLPRSDSSISLSSDEGDIKDRLRQSLELDRTAASGGSVVVSSPVAAAPPAAPPPTSPASLGQVSRPIWGTTAPMATSLTIPPRMATCSATSSGQVPSPVKGPHAGGGGVPHMGSHQQPAAPAAAVAWVQHCADRQPAHTQPPVPPISQFGNFGRAVTDGLSSSASPAAAPIQGLSSGRLNSARASAHFPQVRAKTSPQVPRVIQCGAAVAGTAPLGSVWPAHLQTSMPTVSASRAATPTGQGRRVPTQQRPVLGSGGP